MFEMIAQVSADTLLPVAQFGVAGLMGGLWWWERRYSRGREEQLTRAHELIVNQREHLGTLLKALQNNTRAIAEFTDAQKEIVRALRKRAGRN
jgi:hypothetical protein